MNTKTLSLIFYLSSLFSCSNLQRHPASVVSDDHGKEIRRLHTEFLKINKRVEKLSEKHNTSFSSWMIRDYAARRFINRPDWEAYLALAKDIAAPISEKDVYRPAPITWDRWLATTLKIEERVKYKAHGLKLNEVLEWNVSSVEGTTPAYLKLGKLKKSANYGANTKQKDALSKREIDLINKIDLVFLLPWANKSSERKFIRDFSLQWTSLICEDSLPENLDILKENPECMSLYQAVKMKKNLIFNKEAGSDVQKMESGALVNQQSLHFWWWYQCWPRLGEEEVKNQNTQCGMITYVEASKTKLALSLLIKAINGFTSTNKTPEEAFDFALKAQRAFVAIHPINKGNGRLSRWIMDYITFKSGLPPLLIFDHNRDLATSNEDYKSLTLSETRKGLEKISECLTKWETYPDAINELEKTDCGFIEKN